MTYFMGASSVTYVMGLGLPDWLFPIFVIVSLAVVILTIVFIVYLFSSIWELKRYVNALLHKHGYELMYYDSEMIKLRKEKK